MFLRMVEDSNLIGQRPIATTPKRNPTTSFLTETTLICAIGARITAASGTRLTLQSILDMRFKWFLF